MTRAAAPIFVSMALHLVAGVILLQLAVRLPPPGKPSQIIQVAVVDKVVTKPAPPPPRPPEPAPPVKLARAPRTVPRSLPPPIAAPVTQALPPPPTHEAPQAAPAPLIVSGITLESTSQGGSFAVGVGNTLRAAPPDRATEPAQVKPYKADHYAAAAQVTELPAVINRDGVNLRKYYPPEALKSGFEGDVVMRLLIDGDGSIARVELVSDPGEGLGAAAEKAIHEYRFRPARINGQPVATTVPFTLHFTIPD